MRRLYRFIGWGFIALSVGLIVTARSRSNLAEVLPAPGVQGPPSVQPTSDAAQWFRRVKPYCNSVEIGTLQQSAPAPATVEGAGYNAACFALAGKIDMARRVIDGVPQAGRSQAVGIVFDVGHPVADAGDDRSAGPIMELVVDYWPNHYMALYHAGMAEYMLGQRDLAKHNLTEFLRFYHERDGWTSNANEVLGRLSNPKIVEDPRRPREP